MRTRRQTYPAATPPIPESLTARPIVQALPASATRSGNGGSEKKNCIRGLWDKKIPTDLLQEILSRLGLKANIHASLVCKTWLKEAVSVRKFQSRPWLFYPQRGSKEGDYLLFDPLHSQTYQLKFPELKSDKHKFSCSRDGWLLVKKDSPSDVIFFLNPFTRERIYLPELPRYFTGHCLTFSAAPTSASCCVISFAYQENLDVFVVLDTWRPGDSVWTTRRFPNRSYGYGTVTCHFSNGMFYCLSTSGYIGVFDPSGATWNVIPVNPCPVFSRRRNDKLVRPVFMTEHEGDIYVMTTRRKNNSKQLVFKLNLERNVWEEMRGLGGLTVFACSAASLTRAGLSAEERNRIYTSHIGDYGRLGIYYLGCVKCSLPAYTTYLSNRSAWLQPPHNNFFSL